MHRLTYIYDLHSSTGYFTPLPGRLALIFLSIALLIAGSFLLVATSHQANSASTANNSLTSIAADETNLPNLRGEEAVEYLKREGLYSSLEEAMAAARYRVYEDEQGDVDYYADNPSLRMSMRFDDRAMRLVVRQPVASSEDESESGKEARAKEQADSKPRYRTSEARLRFVGAGYANRIVQTAGEPEMSAEGNRFTYHHQLSGQGSGVRGH